MISSKTMRQVFSLSEAPSPPMIPYSSPGPYTLYTCVYTTYSHREGGES